MYISFQMQLDNFVCVCVCVCMAEGGRIEIIYVERFLPYFKKT